MALHSTCGLVSEAIIGLCCATKGYAGLNLTSSQNDDVARFLRNFQVLSKDERESTRASVVEKIFPLAFGDRAVIQSSANYNDLKQKLWSVHLIIACVNLYEHY